MTAVQCTLILFSLKHVVIIPEFIFFKEILKSVSFLDRNGDRITDSVELRKGSKP